MAIYKSSKKQLISRLESLNGIFAGVLHYHKAEHPNPEELNQRGFERLSYLVGDHLLIYNGLNNSQSKEIWFVEQIMSFMGNRYDPPEENYKQIHHGSTLDGAVRSLYRTHANVWIDNLLMDAGMSEDVL